MKVFLFLILFVFSSLALYSQVRKPKAPAKASAGASSSLLKLSAGRGKVVYAVNCLPCHQADGGGVPNLNPPLIQTPYVTGDKTRLITIILKGLDKDIEINGDTYSNPMPPHDFLKDQEIADVLTYIRNAFGNKAGAVTAPEVKKLRK